MFLVVMCFSVWKISGMHLGTFPKNVFLRNVTLRNAMGSNSPSPRTQCLHSSSMPGPKTLSKTFKQLETCTLAPYPLEPRTLSVTSSNHFSILQEGSNPTPHSLYPKPPETSYLEPYCPEPHALSLTLPAFFKHA